MSCAWRVATWGRKTRIAQRGLKFEPCTARYEQPERAHPAQAPSVGTLLTGDLLDVRGKGEDSRGGAGPAAPGTQPLGPARDQKSPTLALGPLPCRRSEALPGPARPEPAAVAGSGAVAAAARGRGGAEARARGSFGLCGP